MQLTGEAQEDDSLLCPHPGVCAGVRRQEHLQAAQHPGGLVLLHLGLQVAHQLQEGMCIYFGFTQKLKKKIVSLVIKLYLFLHITQL